MSKHGSAAVAWADDPFADPVAGAVADETVADETVVEPTAADDPTPRRYTVSKLADRVGTSADALRYYERIGLLPEPERTPSGYRLYDEEAVERVLFIKRAQRFGLRLEAIGELLQIRERGLCPCGHTRLLLERRLSEIDEEMNTLARLRADVDQMIDALPAPLSVADGWQCSSDLIQIAPRKPPTPPNPRPKETKR
jgi:DNA-binding transcriptional MerR regulator